MLLHQPGQGRRIMDRPVTAEHFRFYGPVLQELNFPSFAGHRDFDQDRLVADLAEAVADVGLAEFVQKGQEAGGLGDHRSNLRSVSSFRTVLKPGRLSFAPASISSHVINSSSSQPGDPAGSGAVRTLPFFSRRI